jgi:homoserine dehydrogenase
VAPEKVLASSPMAKISGSSSYLYFETDIFPGLALTEENPGLYATAYGMLADFVRSVRNDRGDS